MRRKLLAVSLAVVALLLFWIANRGAYRNFFQADSLDNIALMQSLPYSELYRPLLIPKVTFDNFRPLGMLFFKLMGRSFGLWFPPYAAALQILHLVNIALLIWILTRLGLGTAAACAGGLFVVLHMALFHVLWEPMFAFDLICGSLCLLSLLAYIEGRWMIAFVLFWLAFRAKENAIVLPAVFLAYEWLLGKRRWKRLLPFFTLAAVLGLQALLNNTVRDSPYTLKFDPASVWKCIVFYSGALLLIPYAGLLIVTLLFVRDRLLHFGLAAFCILLVPMLVLPGRLFSAYLYVPLIGAAIAAGALSRRQPWIAIAILAALWIPGNYAHLRSLRRVELERAVVARHYVDSIIRAAQTYPAIRTYLYHEMPMESYAISAVVHLVHPGPGDVNVFPLGAPAAAKALESGPVVLLDWQAAPFPGSVVTLAHTSDTPDASYIVMNRATPVWQLGRGWSLGEKGPFRWIEPAATARLLRPADAKQFALTVNIFPAFLKYVPRGHVRVSLNGHAIGERDFDKAGVEVVRWNLDKAPAGPVEVSFETQPGFHTPEDQSLFGLSVGNFGFVTQ